MPETLTVEQIKSLHEHHEALADEISCDIGAFVQEGGGTPRLEMVERLKLHIVAENYFRRLLCALSPAEPTGGEQQAPSSAK